MPVSNKMDLHSYIEPNIQYLRFLGLWQPKTCSRILYYMFTCFLFTFFHMPLAISPYYQQIFIDDFSINNFSNSAFMDIALSVVPLKALILIFWHKSFQVLMDSLENFTFRLYKPEQEVIVKDAAKHIKLGNHYVTICLVSVMAWSMRPFANFEKRPTLLNIWYPFDPRANDFYYAIAYIYTFLGKYFELILLGNYICLHPSLGVCLGALVNGTLCSLLVGFIVFATAQLQILKNTVKDCGNDAIDEGEVYRIIRDCATRYSEVAK